MLVFLLLLFHACVWVLLLAGRDGGWCVCVCGGGVGWGGAHGGLVCGLSVDR